MEPFDVFQRFAKQSLLIRLDEHPTRHSQQQEGNNKIWRGLACANPLHSIVLHLWHTTAKLVRSTEEMTRDL